MHTLLPKVNIQTDKESVRVNADSVTQDMYSDTITVLYTVFVFPWSHTVTLMVSVCSVTPTGLAYVLSVCVYKYA